MIARLAVGHPDEPDATYLGYLPLIRTAATDDRNEVKKAVNWALRQIGKRDRALHAAGARRMRGVAGPRRSDRPMGRPRCDPRATVPGDHRPIPAGCSPSPGKGYPGPAIARWAARSASVAKSGSSRSSNGIAADAWVADSASRPSSAYSRASSSWNQPSGAPAVSAHATPCSRRGPPHRSVRVRARPSRRCSGRSRPKRPLPRQLHEPRALAGTRSARPRTHPRRSSSIRCCCRAGRASGARPRRSWPGRSRARSTR